MIAAAELAIQRRLTAAFIGADRISVVLVRTPRVDDGAGGVSSGTPVPLPPQWMRLIPLREVGSTKRETADGEQVTPTYALLGSHTADMQRWDEFTHGGRRYQVVFVQENRQYEIKGEVAYLG